MTQPDIIQVQPESVTDEVPTSTNVAPAIEVVRILQKLEAYVDENVHDSKEKLQAYGTIAAEYRILYSELKKP